MTKEEAYVLHRNKVSPNQRNIIIALEHLDYSCMVNTGNEDGQEVGQEGGLFLQVEREGLVVAGHWDR